ncbi:MAG: hypothetical protein ACI3ZY_06295 [Parabacteroides sp.]
MRVNKDLMESLMMVSFIILVLVGTTHFDQEATKYLIMGGLGIIIALTGILRYVVAPKQKIERIE